MESPVLEKLTQPQLIQMIHGYQDKIAELESLVDMQETEARIKLIDVAYERTRMAQIVTMKERIAELEACPEHPYVKQLQQRIAELETENSRITELALDQAEQAIKRIGELEAALQYERNFPSYGVERRKIA